MLIVAFSFMFDKKHLAQLIWTFLGFWAKYLFPVRWDKYIKASGLGRITQSFDIRGAAVNLRQQF